jgi:hypothetical protein
MSTTTEQLLDYLRQRADLMSSMQNQFKGKYKSDEALLLDYGIVFDKSVKPSPIKGEPKLCYKNCADAILSRSDLYYCEGYGIDEDLPIPVYHAWLVNDDGEVIDPTWLTKNKAIYLGVVFNKKYVLKMLTEIREYSIIENDYKVKFRLKNNGFTSEMLNSKFHK